MKTLIHIKWFLVLALIAASSTAFAVGGIEDDAVIRQNDYAAETISNPRPLKQGDQVYYRFQVTRGIEFDLYQAVDYAQGVIYGFSEDGAAVYVQTPAKQKGTTYHTIVTVPIKDVALDLSTVSSAAKPGTRDSKAFTNTDKDAEKSNSYQVAVVGHKLRATPALAKFSDNKVLINTKQGLDAIDHSAYADFNSYKNFKVGDLVYKGTRGDFLGEVVGFNRLRESVAVWGLVKEKPWRRAVHMVKFYRLSPTFSDDILITIKSVACELAVSGPEPKPEFPPNELVKPFSNSN